MIRQDVRVCPRCGEPAGEERFCTTCGLNLAELTEVPTRAEWEAASANPAAVDRSQRAAGLGLQSGQESGGRSAPPSGPDEKERSSTEKATPSDSPRGASAGRTRLILAGAALLVIAVVAIVLATSGGGHKTAASATITHNTRTSGSGSANPPAIDSIAAVESDAAQSAHASSATCAKVGYSSVGALIADQALASTDPSGVTYNPPSETLDGFHYAQFACTTDTDKWLMVWWQKVPGVGWDPISRLESNGPEGPWTTF